MFSTDFIFRQQENLVDNQKCQAGFRPLCNKILLLNCKKCFWITCPLIKFFDGSSITAVPFAVFSPFWVSSTGIWSNPTTSTGPVALINPVERKINYYYFSFKIDNMPNCFTDEVVLKNNEIYIKLLNLFQLSRINNLLYLKKCVGHL